MQKQTRDFDTAAATWDEEPKRLKLAGDIAATIKASIPLSSSMDMMDFGCGTGLLALQLHPLVGSVTGVDSSKGMLEILAAKAENMGLANVSVLHRDMAKGDALEGSFDLITCSMAFHHIPDTRQTLHCLHERLKPGGYLAVADLDPDDGQFHEDATGVHHNGFDRVQMKAMFEQAGLADVGYVTATTVKKPSAEGELRAFDIFLITGRRP